MILILFLLIWNFAISWLNCWYVGRSWAESKVVGGWARMLTWAAAVMGTCGFIWCNVLVIGFAASTHAGILPVKYQLTDPYFELLIDLGYVLVVFPILGSGMMIWVDSLIQAYKQRDGLSIGVATYNTFAQVHNTYEAAKFLPTVFEKIGKTLKATDQKALLLTVYACLAVSIGAGLGLAYYIIHSTAVKVAQQAKVSAQVEAKVAKR